MPETTGSSDVHRTGQREIHVTVRQDTGPIIIYRSQILFPVSSLKDEESGITKSATGDNKSKYISSKWEEGRGG